MSAAAIADDGTNFFRHIIEMSEEVFNGRAVELRISGYRLIGLINVGLVVLVVVKPHCLGIDVRLIT
jgi:hypothetical protein